MAGGWESLLVREVQVGDVVRTQSGVEVVVSRIEQEFLGIPTMLAFIQDTPDGWFKCPQPLDGQIEVKRAA